MVKHIILFNVKEDANKQEVISAASQALEPLAGQIPGLLKVEVRECFCGPDFALYTELESKEALDVYANHPLHLAAKEKFFPWIAQRIPADYQL